jgi:hypothetical protein
MLDKTRSRNSFYMIFCKNKSRLDFTTFTFVPLLPCFRVKVAAPVKALHIIIYPSNKLHIQLILSTRHQLLIQDGAICLCISVIYVVDHLKQYH